MTVANSKWNLKVSSVMNRLGNVLISVIVQNSLCSFVSCFACYDLQVSTSWAISLLCNVVLFVKMHLPQHLKKHRFVVFEQT